MKYEIRVGIEDVENLKDSYRLTLEIEKVKTIVLKASTPVSFLQSSGPWVKSLLVELTSCKWNTEFHSVDIKHGGH